MNTKKILETDIQSLKIASLPVRPTASRELGGRGYSPRQMREAFDKLPLYIIAAFNSLLDDIRSEGEGSLSAEIPTGIRPGHTLSDLFSDLTNGNLAAYLQIDGKTLAEHLAEIRLALQSLTD